MFPSHDRMVYQIPRGEVSFNRFEELRGKKYDYKANLLYLFGLKKHLKRKANKRIYCSELVANMLGLKEPWKYSPKDIEKELRKNPSYIMNL